MYNKIIGYKYVIGNFVKNIMTKHEDNFKKIGRFTLENNCGNYIMEIKIGNI